MLVPDIVRRSVVFVCYKTHTGFTLIGTAFFVAILPEEDIGLHFVYLVTAKHVIVQARQKGSDGKVWLRVNNTEGGSDMVESPADAWIDHREDATVDAMVLPWAPPVEKVDYSSVPNTMIVSDEIIEAEGVGPGDELFLTGLFVSHVGRKRNQPIIRTGNIALMPDERVASRAFGSVEAYLVEARSIGGLSGSPVFVHISGNEVRKGVRRPGRSVFYLLGLMHGHWDVSIDEAGQDVVLEDTAAKEAVNMGIGIVIPGSKIMEVLYQPEMVAGREEALRQHLESGLPTEDASSAQLDDERPFTREGFHEALRKVSRSDKQEPKSNQDD